MDLLQVVSSVGHLTNVRPFSQLEKSYGCFPLRRRWCVSRPWRLGPAYRRREVVLYDYRLAEHVAL